MIHDKRFNLVPAVWHRDDASDGTFKLLFCML